MKTVLSFLARPLLLGAGLGLSGLAAAQSPRSQPVAIDQVADFVYLVRVSNPAQLPGQLQVIRSSDGEILYYGPVSRRAVFGGKLNIRGLSDGQYTFLIKVGKETHRYSLDLNTVVQRSARLGTVGLTAMNAPQ
jgi:hypothetical protein